MTNPGDITGKELIDSILRVNHAGEYGAKRIYEGQMAILKNSPSLPIIKHMAEQEQEHLDYFVNAIGENKARPTIMMPLWHIGAYAMGAITAMMGEKAAMACTVAVEEVIGEHYNEQLEKLGSKDNELKEKIKKFRDDELEHLNTGIDNHAEEAPAYPVLRKFVGTATKLAIMISKRI